MMKTEMTQQTRLDMSEVPHQEFGKERLTTTCSSCHYQVRELRLELQLESCNYVRPPCIPGHNQRGEQY